ncbi:acid-shock protein [Budvicia diplopodorum]|uniref:acid-shock protein n=1 Tax=Budvicia diplopodorum TaxID=1119056 RepID=UPI00135B2661|nr:acid-shock protein [Budvicia diplopodorum]
MKKLLSLAVASMFVLSGTAFAAETVTQPAQAATEQSSAAPHKASEKTKHHKAHSMAKKEAKVAAEPAAK